MSQSNGNGGDIPQPTASELKFMIMVLSNQQNKAVVSCASYISFPGFWFGCVTFYVWFYDLLFLNELPYSWSLVALLAD